MKSNLFWTKEVQQSCTCEILGSDKDDNLLLGIDPDCPIHGISEGQNEP